MPYVIFNYSLIISNGAHCWLDNFDQSSSIIFSKGIVAEVFQFKVVNYKRLLLLHFHTVTFILGNSRNPLSRTIASWKHFVYCSTMSYHVCMITDFAKPINNTSSWFCIYVTYQFDNNKGRLDFWQLQL